MTDIYLDPSAAAMADSADQLRHLTDTGHRVIVLGDMPSALADEAAIEHQAELPDVPAPGSWLLTADPNVCGDRRPTLQTMLVGPRPAPSPRPAPRCDIETRDLASAVLEILRHEVMG
jgi:hypothetical protein